MELVKKNPGKKLNGIYINASGISRVFWGGYQIQQEFQKLQGFSPLKW